MAGNLTERQSVDGTLTCSEEPAVEAFGGEEPNYYYDSEQKRGVIDYSQPGNSTRR